MANENVNRGERALFREDGRPKTPAELAADAAAEKLAWWQRTIVYECYPKSFQDTRGKGTGTLRGVIEHLDYLQRLGIGALWLTPIYPSPMKDNGYDVADYCAINPEFGTMEDMEELIAEAGERDIRLVMDLVLNHTSDEHPWFIESSSSRENPKAEWYIWADPKPDGSAPTNWRSCFGGSAWTWCEARGQYYLHTFGSYQPDLNWECPEVRHAMHDVARFWLAKGVGGFRIDAVIYLKKPEFVDAEVDDLDMLGNIHDMTANRPGIMDFLREFHDEVMAGTDAFTVGEASSATPETLRDWVGPNGVFDIIIEYSHINVIRGKTPHWYERPGWKLTDLTDVITRVQANTAEEGWCSVYFENHDQPRSPNHFFPHCRDYEAEAKLLGLVLLTMRGTPFIYQGEELAMTNIRLPSIDDYFDPEVKNQYRQALDHGFTPERALELCGEYSRDNARSPMQWTDGPNAGFTTGVPWLPVNPNYPEVNAKVEGESAASVLSWFRHLAYLRNRFPLLLAGAYRELLRGEGGVYAFERTLEGLRAVVLANFTDEPKAYDPALVAGLAPHTSSRGAPESVSAGELRPLEAVFYVTPELI